jgi:uncharacterized membrane protein YhfC
MFVLGITYFEYIVYGVMINTGAFGSVLEQVAALAPDQVDSVIAVVNAIAGFSFADLGLAVIERIFAVLFHVGASILVFYASRDGKRFWLYPLAVVIHTGMDFFAALSLFGVISIPAWTTELIFAVFGTLTFLGAYLLLYRKDKTPTPEQTNEIVAAETK